LPQVSAERVSVRVPPALAQVSVQTVSVRAQLASQQVSSQQAARVESRSPLWRELAQASLRAAYEQLPVCLASYVPPGGLRSYSRVAHLQQASQALPQRPDEQQHTALPQGRLLQLRRCVAVPLGWSPDAPPRHGWAHHDLLKQNWIYPVSQLVHVAVGPQSQECEAGWRRLAVPPSVSRQLHSGRR
jgi:hypothetical protein